MISITDSIYIERELADTILISNFFFQSSTPSNSSCKYSIAVDENEPGKK